MGYMRHHAIVVTSWRTESIGAAQEEAIRLGCAVSDIVPGVTNGYRSFLVAPDGSKEGWPESDEGDARRNQFVAWLFGEEGSYCKWAEVQYGDDNGADRILRHSGDASLGIDDVVVTVDGLPPGLVYDSQTSTISGTPTETGTWQVDIETRLVDPEPTWEPT